MSVLGTFMSSNLSFTKALAHEEFLLAFPLVSVLNPQLKLAQYEYYLKDMLDLGNYHLYLAYNTTDELIGICGCWIATKFYTGRYLEIDNFIIDPAHQQHQYGSQFVTFIEKVATEADCSIIMLDAYVENFAGHRFYYRNGFIARGFHYLKQL